MNVGICERMSSCLTYRMENIGNFVSMCTYVYMYVCVCVCVRACVRACVCVEKGCLCVSTLVCTYEV